MSVKFLHTDFSFEEQTSKYKGKVRDIYEFGNKFVMIATNRISAFDTILPCAIPYKGQILNLLARHFLESTSHIVPNWLEKTPHSNVMIGKQCDPIKIEMVVRSYLTGHLWRVYRSGQREICGVPIPEGLKENDRLPAPIITPTTKSECVILHDQDIPMEDVPLLCGDPASNERLQEDDPNGRSSTPVIPLNTKSKNGHYQDTSREETISQGMVNEPDYKLQEKERLPTPIIPLATNSENGHDQDISRSEIISQGKVSESDYQLLEKYSLQLFDWGTKYAAQKGLILVDTKYEFGKYDDKIYLIDEIHTPDSSRYFYADTYEKLLHSNKPQRQLSKEFVREWLISKGFQGKEGQELPTISDKKAQVISKRYIELYEQLLGKKFVKNEPPTLLQDIRESIEKELISLKYPRKPVNHSHIIEKIKLWASKVTRKPVNHSHITENNNRKYSLFESIDQKEKTSNLPSHRL